jgi:hypothetical protein
VLYHSLFRPVSNRQVSRPKSGSLQASRTTTGGKLRREKKIAETVMRKRMMRMMRMMVMKKTRKTALKTLRTSEETFVNIDSYSHDRWGAWAGRSADPDSLYLEKILHGMDRIGAYSATGYTVHFSLEPTGTCDG